MEYKRYLILLAKYPDETIVPTVDADKFWHAHILDTMRYAEDCEQVFGYFLHHYPYFGLRGEQDAVNQNDAADTMRRLYQKEFGQAQSLNDSAYCAKVNVTYCAKASDRVSVAASAEAAYCAKANVSYCAKASDQVTASASQDVAYCAKVNVSYCAKASDEVANQAEQKAAYCAKSSVSYCAKASDAVTAAATLDLAYCAKANVSYCAKATKVVVAAPELQNA